MIKIDKYIIEKFKISKDIKVNTFESRDWMLIIKVKAYVTDIYISFYCIAQFLKAKDNKIYYEKNEPWEQENKPYIINSNKKYEYQNKTFLQSTLFLNKSQAIDFIDDIIIKEHTNNLKNWLDKDEPYNINNYTISTHDKKDFESVLSFFKS